MKYMLLKLLAWSMLACSCCALATGFTLQDIQGKTHQLTDYHGKWVLVNFWATWCPPCLTEIPELNSLHIAHQDTDLVVIGIAMESGSKKNVADFARTQKIIYPVVSGNQKLASQIGELEALPTSYLYAPNGELVSYQAGTVTRAGIESYIKQKKYH